MDVKIDLTRVVDGREIPPVGTWIIDPSHSEVEFMVRHMMISEVRGRFRQFDGTIVIAQRPEDSRVTRRVARVDAGGVDEDLHASICARPISSTASNSASPGIVPRADRGARDRQLWRMTST